MIYSTIEVSGNVLINRKVILSGNVIPERILISGDVRVGGSGGAVYPIYTGEYTVIPQTYEQYLATRNKLMTDNVTVEEIPYHETTNTYGITAIIAS